MSRAVSLTIMVLAVLATGACPLPYPGGLIGAPMAEAQNIGQRTVTGTVFDNQSTPVSGALVFLQSQKNKTIRSYTSDSKGQFHFAQIDMAQDFNL